MNDRSQRMEKVSEERSRYICQVLFALQSTGIPIESTEELLHKGPHPNSILPVLLKYTGNTEPGLDSLLAMALKKVRDPQDPAPLLELFENCDDGVRWQIADSIAEAKLKEKIDDWLARILPDSNYGKSREMLCLAAGRHMDKSRAENLLIGVYDDLPGHVPLGLKLVGGEKSLDFLRSKRGIHGDWKDKKTEQAIRRIERRLEREKAKQAKNIAPIHKQRDRKNKEEKQT